MNFLNYTYLLRTWKDMISDFLTKFAVFEVLGFSIAVCGIMSFFLGGLISAFGLAAISHSNSLPSEFWGAVLNWGAFSFILLFSGGMFLYIHASYFEKQ